MFAPLITISETQWFMPVWSQILVSISVLIIACGIIWKKIVKPAANLITLLDDALPLLRELVEQFEGQPQAFKVLNEIAAQFRTDSGSSLRDVVNRLEKAANENAAVAITLGINLEAERKLAQESREQLAKLNAVLAVVDAKAHTTEAGVTRLEKGAVTIANELHKAQDRAGKVENGQPGEAADAAAKREKK